MDQKINDIIEDAKEYTMHQIELLKLTLAERYAFFASEIVSKVIIGSFLILFLFFISVSGGLFFGELLNNDALGFLIIALIYLVFTLILHFGQKTLLKRKIVDKTIKKIFEDED